MGTNGVESVEEKLTAARERKRLRDAKRDLEASRLELLVLELEERFEGELEGARGDAFEIVETTLGPIVVRHGESVLYKRFQSAMGKHKDGNPTQEDCAMFVTTCVVHPEKDTFLSMTEKQPHLWFRCANALASLFGTKEEESRGKY